MPIFHDLKLAFVHIPKTAGTSIEKACFTLSYEKNKTLDLNLDAFNLYNDPSYRTEQVSYSLYKGDISKDKNFLYYIKKHCPYNKMLDIFPEIVDYTAFTIVRNPFERVVSYFYYHYSKKIGFFQNNKVKLEKADADDLKVIFCAYLEEFINSHRKIEHKSQASYITDYNNNIYTNIIILRFENLLNDLGKFFPVLGISAIPHITHRKKSIIVKPVNQLITRYTRDIIYEFFMQDFNKLNYSKDINECNL